MLITEHELDRFRSECLTPSEILLEVERRVQALYRLAVGVGKSEAVDRLVGHPDTYQRFGLVVCTAPTWNIINERTLVADPTRSPVRSTVLRPRPADDCGDYAKEWERLEQAGCSALGKGTLCRSCQTGVPQDDRCFWPKQFSELDGYQLIFATEQQLVLNRSLISMRRGSAPRHELRGLPSTPRARRLSRDRRGDHSAPRHPERRRRNLVSEYRIPPRCLLGRGF